MMIIHSKFQAIDRKILNDVGLKHLPEDWHRMIDIPNTKWLDVSKDKCRGDWSISHVSAESFFRNKCGIEFMNFVIIDSSYMLKMRA